MEYIGVHQMKLNMIGGHKNKDPELLTLRSKNDEGARGHASSGVCASMKAKDMTPRRAAVPHKASRSEG